MSNKKFNQKQNNVFACKLFIFVKFRDILVVDDDIFNQEVIEMILFKGGYNFKIFKAFNGQKAISKYKNKLNEKCGTNCRIFNFILMDFDMPIKDGMETTKEIRIGK